MEQPRPTDVMDVGRSNGCWRAATEGRAPRLRPRATNPGRRRHSGRTVSATHGTVRRAASYRMRWRPSKTGSWRSLAVGRQRRVGLRGQRRGVHDGCSRSERRRADRVVGTSTQESDLPLASRRMAQRQDLASERVSRAASEYATPRTVDWQRRRTGQCRVRTSSAAAATEVQSDT